MPLFVTSYAWASIGVLLQGFWGAAGIISFSYYPIVFLLVAVALRGLDPSLEESARSLGLNGFQVFFRVILPQIKPALLGGLLLVALDALVEFDAFVALKFQTFSLDVYGQYRLGFSTSAPLRSRSSRSSSASCCCSGKPAFAETRTTRASARPPAVRRPATGSGSGSSRSSPGSGS